MPPSVLTLRLILPAIAAFEVMKFFGVNMNPTHLIPALSSSEAKQQFNETTWYLFARRCQRNPYMREMILERDLSKPCEWCNKPIYKTQSWNVHHIDYAHECTFNVTTTERTVSVRNNPRNYTGPDCRTCAVKHPEMFDACFSRLKLVHYLCNRQIELERQKAKRQSESVMLPKDK